MTGRALGDAVRVVMQKWGGRPHWEYDARWLGEDEHGSWVGLPVGTVCTRPGRRFVIDNLQVTLVPDDDWWVATFHGEGERKPWPDLGDDPVEVYVDMATPATWSGPSVTCTDLDLDVVLGIGGRLIVDDEDEFADHRVRFGYPAEVVAAAQRSCADVLERVGRRAAPYDGATARTWLARLARLLAEESASATSST